MEGWLYPFVVFGVFVSSELIDLPKFGEPIINVTVPVGREAVLMCVVDDLSTYKVAWLRVDTQTILTIHSHVITKNHRIGVTHSDHRTWYLHIREVRESDRGWYMCQINTDPMKSQVGFLDVVVPPDILDYPTSTDVMVREGTNITLRCAATGAPPPNITWKRETGDLISLGNGLEVASWDGPVLNITRVNRMHMGPYLCIASNGVPPSVSKRIMVIVNFPPMIWIQNQLIGAYIGQQLTLECHSEAYPKAINYWAGEKGDVIARGTKLEPMMFNNAYKVHMKLTINSVSQSDYGTYKCISKNSQGETDGTIKIYPIPYNEIHHSTTKPKLRHSVKGGKGKFFNSPLCKQAPSTYHEFHRALGSHHTDNDCVIGKWKKVKLQKLANHINGSDITEPKEFDQVEEYDEGDEAVASGAHVFNWKKRVLVLLLIVHILSAIGSSFSSTENLFV